MHRLLFYSLLAVVLMISLVVFPGRASAQSGTVTDDAFLSSNATTQLLNLNGQGGSLIVAGSSATVGPLHVGATKAYIQFQLQSSLPPTTAAANVAKATLKLFLSGANPSGAIDVYPVTSAWTESTLATSPPTVSSTAFATGIAVGKTDQFLVVDVTQLVQQWLEGSANGGLDNDGIALVADTSTSYVVFDSKESIVTSHEPRLEIVLVDSGPQGPQGVPGPPGPAGPGSVLGVSSGPGIIGGPITTNGTLSLDTSFTNGLYARLAAPNIFFGNQAINGNFGVASVSSGGGVASTSNLSILPYAGNGSAAFSVEADSLDSTSSGDLISTQLRLNYGFGAPVQILNSCDRGGCFGTAMQISTNVNVGQALELDCTQPASDCEGVVANGISQGGVFFANQVGLFAEAPTAGMFQGDVDISGTLTKGAGAFKIDHPLDPANKYLTHSFVESPDMMNIYNGTVILDSNGEAWINLPDWFEALNRDFRYQLTAIGAPGPNLYVAEEVSGNRFKIAGGQPGRKVSWQVTGIRHDAYADAHRLAVEEDKPEADRGFYLHPEVHGQPAEKSIFRKRIPRLKHADVKPQQQK